MTAGGVAAVATGIAGVHVAYSRMAVTYILLTTLVTVRSRFWSPGGSTSPGSRSALRRPQVAGRGCARPLVVVAWAVGLPASLWPRSTSWRSRSRHRSSCTRRGGVGLVGRAEHAGRVGSASSTTRSRGSRSPKLWNSRPGADRRRGRAPAVAIARRESTDRVLFSFVGAYWLCSFRSAPLLRPYVLPADPGARRPRRPLPPVGARDVAAPDRPVHVDGPGHEGADEDRHAGRCGRPRRARGREQAASRGPRPPASRRRARARAPDPLVPWPAPVILATARGQLRLGERRRRRPRPRRPRRLPRRRTRSTTRSLRSARLRLEPGGRLAGPWVALYQLPSGA